MLKKTLVPVALVFFSFFFNTPSSYGASLIFDEYGKLAGATGVDVSGSYFDVMFVDGTCVELFDGCNSWSDFTFGVYNNLDMAQENAKAASQALLDQVFINSFSPLDTYPHLIRGCEDSNVCHVLTVFAAAYVDNFIRIATADNRPGTSDDSVDGIGGTITSRLLDFSEADHIVYAKWSVSQVPLPSAVVLFLSAMIGLIEVKHKPLRRT